MPRGEPVSGAERELMCRLRAEGHTIVEVMAITGRGHSSVERAVAAAGGLPPRDRRVRSGCLTAAEREEITRRIAVGESNPEIARALGRAPSTIWREVTANGGRSGYRAWAGAYAFKRLPRYRRPRRDLHVLGAT